MRIGDHQVEVVAQEDRSVELDARPVGCVGQAVAEDLLDSGNWLEQEHAQNAPPRYEVGRSGE